MKGFPSMVVALMAVTLLAASSVAGPLPHPHPQELDPRPFAPLGVAPADKTTSTDVEQVEVLSGEGVTQATEEGEIATAPAAEGLEGSESVAYGYYGLPAWGYYYYPRYYGYGYVWG